MRGIKSKILSQGNHETDGSEQLLHSVVTISITLRYIRAI